MHTTIINSSPHLIFVVLMMLCIAIIKNGYTQDSIISKLPKGKWISNRGPFDPRPYDNTLFGSLLFTDDYFNWKNKLWIDKGISFGGYFSANIQIGSQGLPTHQISETLILFTWEPLRKARSAGRLVVGFAYDLTFGKPTTRGFADNQKLIETPNDLDTDPDQTFATLGLLHWTQEWRTGPNGGWAIRAGQLYAPSYFGPARYLDDDRRFFMARPVAAAAGAQWVGNNDIGLGVNALYWKTPFYISVAVMDGKANRNYPDVKSLGDAEFLYLAEVGLERDIDGPNEATLRITFSHLDLTDKSGPGQSLMISGDMLFNGVWGIAARYSRSFKRFTSDYKELVSLGFLWEQPFNRSQDLAGLGVFTGKPSDPNHNW
ncbi:MAG: hypothetical protein C0591_00385, partial [Marinilabiliales bacterium]